MLQFWLFADVINNLNVYIGNTAQSLDYVLVLLLRLVLKFKHLVFQFKSLATKIRDFVVEVGTTGR